jgi:hypothetical protein
MLPFKMIGAALASFVTVGLVFADWGPANIQREPREHEHRAFKPARIPRAHAVLATLPAHHVEQITAILIQDTSCDRLRWAASLERWRVTRKHQAEWLGPGLEGVRGRFGSYETAYRRSCPG